MRWLLTIQEIKNTSNREKQEILILIKGCCASISSSQPKQMRQIQAIHCSGFQTGFTVFNKLGALIHSLPKLHHKTVYSGSFLLCACAWKFPKKFNFTLL